MQKEVKTFVDQVYSINPTVSTSYGSALTVGSRNMAGSGISNSPSVILFKLREETAAFAELIDSGQGTTDIETKAKAIEGYLMTLQLLGQISEQFCASLLATLNNIVKA